jgi:hypothetical protein
MLKVSLQTNLYMTYKDQVFVANVVIIDFIQKMMVSNVINWPTSATTKLNAIAKIRKYRELQMGHLFIPMAMEVHNAPRHDSLGSVLVFCMIDNQKIIYPCLIAFNFSSNMLILLSNVL